MDEDQARTLLRAERLEVQHALERAAAAGQQDRDSGHETGDETDPGRALADEAVDDAAAASLRDRLAALDRAEQRLAEGTFGRSIRSGRPIPDERLETDPAAELTVDEAENT